MIQIPDEKNLVRKNTINLPFANDLFILTIYWWFAMLWTSKIFFKTTKRFRELSYNRNNDMSLLIIGILMSSMGSSSFRGRMGEPRFCCRKSSLLYPFGYTVFGFVFEFVFITFTHQSGYARCQNLSCLVLRNFCLRIPLIHKEFFRYACDIKFNLREKREIERQNFIWIYKNIFFRLTAFLNYSYQLQVFLLYF